MVWENKVGTVLEQSHSPIRKYVQTNLDFSTSHFWRNFFKYHSKGGSTTVPKYKSAENENFYSTVLKLKTLFKSVKLQDFEQENLKFRRFGAKIIV